jgi:hypothetical protein
MGRAVAGFVPAGVERSNLDAAYAPKARIDFGGLLGGLMMSAGDQFRPCRIVVDPLSEPRLPLPTAKHGARRQEPLGRRDDVALQRADPYHEVLAFANWQSSKGIGR